MPPKTSSRRRAPTRRDDAPRGRTASLLRRAREHFATGTRSGFRQGMEIVGTSLVVALFTLGGRWLSISPGPEEIAAWKDEVTRDATHVESDARKTSWRKLRDGQLDIYEERGVLRKLVRHPEREASREFFFTGDTLTFVFVRGPGDQRFGRAPQGAGHRHYFHRLPRLLGGDTLRMFAWVAPGSAAVDPGTAAFAAAERELLREAAELWRLAHSPRPAYNDSLARLYPRR